MNSLYPLVQKVLFFLPPETAHNFTLKLAEQNTLASFFQSKLISEHRHRFKLEHRGLNGLGPIGLAAGLDKDALALDFFSKMGLSPLEFGTVTLNPQSGNPKPRVWRIKKEQSIRNAMGFPGPGLEKVQNNFLNNHYARKHSLIGANIGPNKDLSFDEILDQYCKLFKAFAPHVDYLTINISSPNTKGLRDLQHIDKLKEIFKVIESCDQNFMDKVFIKIAPDLDDKSIIQMCELTKDLNLLGLIATNTTTDHQWGTGGISGKLLKEKAKKVRKIILESFYEVKEQQTLIGVGGIDDIEEIKEHLSFGGKWIQIYSALIYKGPNLITELYQELLKEMDKYQVENLQELRTFYMEERK